MYMKLSRTFTEFSLCVSLSARMELMRACVRVKYYQHQHLPSHFQLTYASNLLHSVYYLVLLHVWSTGCGHLQEATNPIHVYSVYCK